MITLKDHYQQKVDEQNRGRRVVSAGGAPPQLEGDLLAGARRAVSNAQTRLALEYLFNIVDAQQAQIEELQAKAGLGDSNEDGPDMPAGPIPKPNPTKEAEPVEERKKTRKPATDAPSEENV